jgi:kinesin family protein 2/24
MTANPMIRVGEPKYKIDGITKYIENQDYLFDNAFGSEDQTSDIYDNAILPTLD